MYLVIITCPTEFICKIIWLDIHFYLIFVALGDLWEKIFLSFSCFVCVCACKPSTTAMKLVCPKEWTGFISEASAWKYSTVELSIGGGSPKVWGGGFLNENGGRTVLCQGLGVVEIFILLRSMPGNPRTSSEKPLSYAGHGRNRGTSF